MTNHWAARDGRESALPSFGQDEQVVFRVCVSILRDPALAWAATNTAMLKVLGGSPEKFDKSRKAWVRKVARHTAIDLLRAEQRERARAERLRKRRIEVQEDPHHAMQHRMDAKQLVDRVLRLIADVDPDDLELYIKVQLKEATERQLANELGITHNALKDRRRRARKKVQEAVAAVYLLTDADHDCMALSDIARNREDSPELLRDIHVHISRCARCEETKTHWKRLRFTIFVISGVVFCGRLAERLTESGTRVKLAACTGLVMVAVSFLLQGTTSSETHSALERQPTIELPIGPMNAMPEAPLSESSPESPTAPTTEAPTQAARALVAVLPAPAAIVPAKPTAGTTKAPAQPAPAQPAPAQPARALVAVPPAPAATVPTKPTAKARAERQTRTHRPEHRRTADPGKKCRKTRLH